MRRKLTIGISAIAAVALTASALAAVDWGSSAENRLRNHSREQFGVGGTLQNSSSRQNTEAQAQSNPRALATLAGSLNARVVTSGEAGQYLDMMALWPNDRNSKWLIVCNEGDVTEPGLQRINVSTGEVATIVTGTDSCDGIRRTPWHSIMFSEEAGGGPEGGRIYELINPLDTTDVTLDRTTGEFSGGEGAENLVTRPAFGRLSYEGFAIYSSGLTYFGDERRPSNGSPGGAYYKFVPSTPIDSGERIESLEESPYAAGSVWGLRLGLREDEGEIDYGQGTELGFGQWLEVCPECNDGDLAALATDLHLTGYYRPEDIDIDFDARSDGHVRFCGNNTGNEDDDQWYGEMVCITDGSPEQALANEATPEVQRLVQGNPELAMPDNLAYQPGRGNWIIHEDAATDYLRPHNNDLWDCLDDGRDDDLLSDGCVRVGTLNDLTAEWTGGIFDATGTRFFVSVQHNISGAGVILEVRGWR